MIIVECKSPIAMVFVNLVAFIVMVSTPIITALLLGMKGNGQWALVLLTTIVVVLLWIRSAYRHLQKTSKPEEDESGYLELIPDPRLD